MKTFRLIGTALLSVVMSVNLASCSKDSKEEEEPVGPPQSAIEDFNQTDMNFTEKAGEQTFSFTANAAWAVSVASTSGGSTWCTASPAQGNAGSQTVKITTTENDTYDDRSVTVTLKAGNESKSFVVTQKQKNAILLTSDKFEIGQQGGTFTVEVKANVNYTATIGETCKDWITEGSDTRALSATTKTYSVAANEESEKREGTITFTDGTLSETVHIYQAGRDIILLSKNEYYVDAAGEEITVELKSNCEYEVEMPDVNWIHTVSTRAMSSHTLHYTVDANTTYDSREAKIVYRNKANDVTETLTVVQAQKDAIILGRKEVTIGAYGEMIEVKLSANVDFEVEMPDVDWIHTFSTRAMSSHTLYYIIDANATYDSREAKIVYRNRGSDIVETLNIIQVQKAAIILGQKEVTVKAEGETIEVKLSASVDFEVEMPAADWVHTVATRGMSSHTLYYTIDANTTYDSREAKIVYRNRGSGISETLTIVQVQKDAIILGQKEVTVKVEGETIEVKLSANVDFEVEMPAVDWITSVSTRGLTEHTLYYNVAKNEGIDSRSAQITFTNKNSGLKEILTVQQEGSAFTINVPWGGYLPNITERRDYKALKLTGYLNGTDIKAIREMDNLEYLDISEAHIVEGGQYYISRPIIYGQHEKFYTENNTIGDYMFEDKSNLKQILLPNSVTTIRRCAFQYCSSLTSIHIPDGVTKIEMFAFQYCSSLTSIHIPDGVTTIEQETFEYCSSLTSIDIPNSVTTIGAWAFSHCSSLTSIKIPDGVTTIWIGAFSYCSSLTSIKIPDGVTTIEEGTFYTCGSLTSIDIPNSVTTIEGSAFSGCSSLTNINIPNSVTTIGEDAFNACDNLAIVKIGTGLKSICNSYLLKHSSITEVYCYAPYPPIAAYNLFITSKNDFAGIRSDAKLYIPKGSRDSYIRSYWGSAFTNTNIIEMEE